MHVNNKAQQLQKIDILLYSADDCDIKHNLLGIGSDRLGLNKIEFMQRVNLARWLDMKITEAC